MKKGIAVAGALVLDRHYTVSAYPSEGLLARISDPTSSIGGTGNLIFDLAKLDSRLPVKVSAIIGRESGGEEIKRQLALYPNIDASAVTEGGSTSVTYVLNSRQSKQRTFFYYPGSSDRYGDEDILWDRIDASLFQLNYLFLLGKADADDAEYGTGCARILAHARSRGMKTSFDMVSEKTDRLRHGCRSAARYADYCSINEVELEGSTGVRVVTERGIDETAMKEALSTLRAWGVSTWAVCHTPHSSYALDCREGLFYKCRSLRLDPGLIKGTTGAGDAFCAGILYCAYSGQSLPHALSFASATAACSLFEKDGTSGMRSREEVEKVFHAYGGEESETF